MMRTAISPRLATSTRRKARAPVSLCKDGTRLQGDVRVLLRRQRLPLALEQRESRREPCARLGWQDHLVDVSARGRDVGVRKPLLVFGDRPRAFRIGVVGG